ncbi:hypothetical protein IHE44_0002300 [Lamprotornis superbus]|uniref:G-protein coupled receptors family 1 profile domain-containing protein n=1 Tax=Lamprotornis superbus TaxID=245042 RepID=A0A835NXN7_9PASS|nr:hypothetical protein IHE44_0002300 [Lamprotornis superbus]
MWMNCRKPAGANRRTANKQKEGSSYSMDQSCSAKSSLEFTETEEMNGRLLCTCRNYSSNRQKVSYLLLETLAGFVIPFFIICTCYACVARRISRMTYQSKQRSERLIASVVVAFILCWFPHHLFNILDIISIEIELSNEEMSLALEEIVDKGVYISGALVFISSCINPLLYAFAARRFQNHLRFAKMSKLFEQISQTVTEEDKKRSLVIAKREDPLPGNTISERAVASLPQAAPCGFTGPDVQQFHGRARALLVHSPKSLQSHSQNVPGKDFSPVEFNAK